MNDYPILFNDEMVRALLRGTKTQTRRKVKVTPPVDATHAGCYSAPGKDYDGKWEWCNGDAKDIDSIGMCDAPQFSCPYGQPGDLLWVREDFQLPSFYDKAKPEALPKTLQQAAGKIHYLADGGAHVTMGKKRLNMYLPRTLSRLTLKLVNVSIEHLNSITFNDAKAEGTSYEKGVEDPREAYRRLWERINGAGSWQINPFVWVLEFTVHKQNIDAFIAERNAA